MLTVCYFFYFIDLHIYSPIKNHGQNISIQGRNTTEYNLFLQWKKLEFKQDLYT